MVSSGATTTICRLSPDLLESICRELLAFPPEGKPLKHIGSRTVAALATTARVFRDPALNVLWHTIADIAVLFYALPDDIYVRSRKQHGLRSPHSLQHFTLDDAENKPSLARFLSYARRVREIRMSTHLSVCSRRLVATPDMYDILAAAVGSRTLLPNLAAIHFKRKQFLDLKIFGAFHFLFGPSLRKLHISVINDWDTVSIDPEEDSDTFAQMLANLATCSPQLEELSVHIRPTDTILSVPSFMAVPLVQPMAHLTTLLLSQGLMPITPALFAHLARMPYLRSLRFCICPDWEWYEEMAALRDQRAADQAVFFPSLHDVRITSPTFDEPILLIPFISSSQLTNVTVVATLAVGRNTLDELICEVVALRAPEKLTELVIQAPYVFPDDADTYVALSTVSLGCFRHPPRPVGPRTLRPLLKLTGLEDLLLDFCCPFDVCDPFLAQCAAAWPGLCRFILGSDRAWGPTAQTNFPPGEHHDDEPGTIRSPAEPVRACVKPKATLFALHAFATHCPHIGDLGFEIDADLGPLRVAPERLETRPAVLGGLYRPLRKLYVGLSTIEDACAVAAFLSDAFPLVTEVEDGWAKLQVKEGTVGWRMARRYHTRWAAVAQLVSKFALVRLQEGRWRKKAKGEAVGEVEWLSDTEEEESDAVPDSEPED
ncbi:hypothetical protein C8Q77DRAFT_910266 [Trametes polyzona]|nr:hypothetical protein C8Q77DRAFT_910266 [Trametes polyzona]